MRLFFIALMLGLVGCASQYGSMVKNNTDANEIIAIDSLKQLTEIYLPAKTTFSLTHPISPKDTFAQVLVNGLRDRGYAVEEFVKGASPIGVKIAFTLDEIRDDGLYRVTLHIDDKVMTRAYQNDAGLITHASAWATKE